LLKLQKRIMLKSIAKRMEDAVKLLKGSLFVGLCALGLGLIGQPGPAAAQSPSQVLLQVCNNVSETAYVAVVAHVSPTDDRWMVSGWFNAEPGGCASIYVAQGWVGVYA
jgi:hypothetical protein